MGYLLLWIESLVCSLLLVAVLIACVGHLRSGWVRWLIGALVLLLPFLCYSLVATADAWLEFHRGVRTGWFWPLVLLTLAYLAGAAEIARRGLKRAETTADVQAAVWPRGKLALALAAALTLHAMTFSNLDAAVKQSLATVRAESTALAMSVAPLRLPDRDNAAVVYQQLFDVFTDNHHMPRTPQVWSDAVDALYLGGKSTFDFKSRELGEFLKEHAGEVVLLRAAAGRPGCYFDRDYGRPSVETFLPEIECMREGARLLAVNARWSAGQGDLDLAFNEVNALYVMARHVESEPFLVSMLVSAEIEHLANVTLEGILNSARPTADQLAIVDPQSSVSYRRLMRIWIRTEEAAVLALFGSLDTVEFSRLWRALTGDVPPAASDTIGPAYRVFLLAGDLADFRAIMREYLNLPLQPYETYKPRLQAIQDEMAHKSILTKLLTPSLPAASEAVDRADAQRRLALTALAMHGYRAKHGRFSDKLDDLSPDVIALVPRDPYDGQPIRLKRTERGWILYSVGPDLKDDGGHTFNVSDLTGDWTFEYTEPADAAVPEQP